MKKRVVCLCLITLLVLSCFVGCRQRESGDNLENLGEGNNSILSSGGFTEGNTQTGENTQTEATTSTEDVGSQTTATETESTTATSRNTTLSEQTTVAEDTPSTPDDEPSQSGETNITCMSFNILGVDSLPEGQLRSTERSPHVVDFIVKQNHDLVGVQEAGRNSFDWCQYMQEEVPGKSDYAAVCLEDQDGFREPSGKQPNGAGLIIFYKTTRFELLDDGAFKYSSTEKQARYYQWVKLKDKKTNEIVYMTNTHWSINWDENGATSVEAGDIHRTKQARELLDFWKKTVGNNLLFATGDYNCNQNSKWYQQVSAGIYKSANDVYDFGALTQTHIDHCFINPERQYVENYYIDTSSISLNGKQYMLSDHKPTVVEVSYK